MYFQAIFFVWVCICSARPLPLPQNVDQVYIDHHEIYEPKNSTERKLLVYETLCNLSTAGNYALNVHSITSNGTTKFSVRMYDRLNSGNDTSSGLKIDSVISRISPGCSTIVTRIDLSHINTEIYTVDLFLTHFQFGVGVTDHTQATLHIKIDVGNDREVTDKVETDFEGSASGGSAVNSTPKTTRSASMYVIAAASVFSILATRLI